MTNRLEDVKINVKIKLAALWVTVMLAYLYADVIYILDLILGEAKVIQMTPVFLLGVAILMVLPIVMVFLSLTLKPKVNRWANIILGIFYTGVILIVQLPTGVLEAYYYYIFYGIVEVVLTALIVWYAWKWPTQEG